MMIYNHPSAGLWVRGLTQLPMSRRAYMQLQSLITLESNRVRSLSLSPLKLTRHSLIAPRDAPVLPRPLPSNLLGGGTHGKVYGNNF